MYTQVIQCFSLVGQILENRLEIFKEHLYILGEKSPYLPIIRGFSFDDREESTFYFEFSM